MEGTNSIASDDAILLKVSQLMKKIEENEKLQKLSEENGLDVKNNTGLTADNRDRVAVSVVALLLAKRAGDMRYSTLVRTGLQKRQIKTDIINSYKDQAIQLIQRYNDKFGTGYPEPSASL